MYQLFRRIPLLFAAVVLLVPAVQASNISFLDTFTNLSYEQVGDGNTLNFNGAFFSADLNANTPNAYTSASFTPPGQPTQALTQQSPTDYGFQTGLLPDLATLQASYPFGTYTFQGTNGGGTDTATLDYTSNDFAQSNPFLTGSNFTALQGMDSSQSFTFHFSPDVTGADATSSFVFFTIFDETLGKSVFDAGFLPSTTTSVTVNGGTLKAGDTFVYELDYSNRNDLTDPAGADFPPELGFDIRTDGVFTTAATSPTPEPRGYAAILAAGLLGLFLLRRRRNIA